MPSRKPAKAAVAAAAALPAIPKELIDQFVTGPMSVEAVQATSMAFKKARIERVLSDGTRDVLGLWIENTEGAKFCDVASSMT